MQASETEAVSVWRIKIEWMEVSRTLTLFQRSFQASEMLG